VLVLGRHDVAVLGGGWRSPLPVDVALAAALPWRTTAQEAGLMNASNILKLVAGLAWVGAAISSATTATAFAVTSQTGDYAACSASYSNYVSESSCGYATSYYQNIRFIDTACNTGECASSGLVYTDQVYPTGRKTTYHVDTCEIGNVYGLGSCAC
jgi:hypothetical protein